MYCIRDLEVLLKLARQSDTLKYGFTLPHSWRGIYAEAAVEPAIDVQVAEMLADIARLLSEQFDAYKGGTYTFNGYTELHLSEWGDSEEHDWGPIIVGLARSIARAAG